VGFILEMQSWFNIQKSINILHYPKRLEKKKDMAMSTEVEKTFDII
jgi:hypothetical protein